MRNVMLKTASKLNDARRRLHRDEEGAGVLEYALVAGVVSAALIAALATFAGDVVDAAGVAVNALI